MGRGGTTPLQRQSASFYYRLARVPENGTGEVVLSHELLIQEALSYGRTKLFFNKR